MGENSVLFCKKCGKQLLPDAGFCNKCGTKVVKESVPSQPMPETPIHKNISSNVPPLEIVQSVVATPPPPEPKKPLERVSPAVVSSLPITRSKKSNYFMWGGIIVGIVVILAVSVGTYFYFHTPRNEPSNLVTDEAPANSSKDTGIKSPVPAALGNTETSEAILSAIQSNDTVSLKNLLDNGGNPNSKDTSGTPVLIVAALIGKTEIVSLLLKKGAKYDVKVEDGETALMAASANGHIDVVQELVGKGADVSLQDNEGWTAFMYAINKNHDDIADYLRKKGNVK